MKIFRRTQFQNEMDAELRFHIAEYVNDLVRSGVERNEAERRARLEFGALEATKDECRQAWGLHARRPPGVARREPCGFRFRRFAGAARRVTVSS